MESLAKGDIRRMLQDYLFGEIEEYLQDHRGVRCPDGWRSEVRGIARRALELLFAHDDAEITEVERFGDRLCFTYVLRGYGVGDTANVSFEREGDDYLRMRFAVLRDGHVAASVTYERDNDEATLSYRRYSGEHVTVMG